MDDHDDPYQILGVSSTASAAEIKKAYRTLALKNHPDKQTSEADRAKASSAFAKIAAAYEILSDDEERKQYDLRKKYGGAPGTRYTTTAPCSSQQQQPQQWYTSSPSSPSRPSSSKTQRVQRTTTSSPDNGTFSFRFDPTKVRSSDPYQIFKDVFGSDFDKAYPGATLNAPHSTRGQSVPVTRTTRNAPVSSGGSPRKNKSATPVTYQQPVSPKKSSPAMMDDDIVSMSTSTKTIMHDDGTQEVITERTITTSDGCTKTTRESNRTSTGGTPRMMASPTVFQTMPGRIMTTSTRK